ncbi:uncharacterized protein LOC120420127 [Culex pipiens pallens]|uniref:uncharacterized protein LOC120420127 n=1 Tax=Culex pipiens pallens TaxID=42434 RepID=UPI0019539514|nr:uncharacterized protein LOC120420127 [Culex pipiens pallens]
MESGAPNKRPRLDDSQINTDDEAETVYDKVYNPDCALDTDESESDDVEGQVRNLLGTVYGDQPVRASTSTKASVNVDASAGVSTVYSKEKIPDGKYGLWVLISIRDFKGHSSGKEIGKWGVAGEDVQTFLHNSWELCKQYLKQEVVFSTEQQGGEARPAWLGSDPQESDFGKFVLFNDKSNRRLYAPEKLTENILQHWRKKEIHVLLHQYSLSVSSKAVFKTVKEALLDPAEKDKSGAAAIRAEEDVVKKLREVHGDKWRAHDIAWKMWATYITAGEPHQHSQMLLEPPPANIVQLFAAKESAVVRNIQRNFSMAHNVQAGYPNEIATLRQAANILKEGIQTITSQFQILDRSIEALEARSSCTGSFIDAAEDAVRVEETDFSNTLAEHVGTQNDNEHM